jgi:adenylate cyclase
MVRTNRLYRRSILLAGLIVVALVLLLDAVGGLRAYDNRTIDARFAIRGTQRPSDVVIVAIDANTLHYLSLHYGSAGHFPFPRHFDARIIKNLKHAGAKVIVYDEQFTEPTDTTDDDDLILASRKAGNVVMATTDVAARGKTDIFGGGSGLAYSRATPGESDFRTDSDGRIRHMLYEILDLTTLPIVAAEKALGHPIKFPGGRHGNALIDFAGPSGSIQTVSYANVFSNRFPANVFRGKVVVVGVTEEDVFRNDIHSTSTSSLMPGVEVEANAIDTALRGFPLRDAPGYLNGVLIVLFGAIGPLIALRRRGEFAVLITVAAVATLALLCQLEFNGGTVVGFIYPAAAALFSSVAILALQGIRLLFERELTRDTFARFVPESVVSDVLASADGVRLGGVRREATVLFSDLRGFTGFAEARPPDETIGILNRYLTTMSDVILENGGTLVSYMGDGIMAVFGAPVVQDDHADRGLATARAMLERLVEFNSWMRNEGHGDGFKMGIGLNSGAVLSGHVGSERRLEYTTIGDTTNTASRLESMTKGTPYQLFVADTTYDRLSKIPHDLVKVAELDVRGRVQKVTAWTLAGTVVDSPTPQPGAEASVQAG